MPVRVSIAMAESRQCLGGDVRACSDEEPLDSIGRKARALDSVIRACETLASLPISSEDRRTVQVFLDAMKKKLAGI
jgi:hypothetical protein